MSFFFIVRWGVVLLNSLYFNIISQDLEFAQNLDPKSS